MNAGVVHTTSALWIALVVGSVMFFLAPLATVGGLLVIMSVVYRQSLAQWMVLVCFIILFVYKNYIKGFDSDYEWYFDHYSYWVQGEYIVPFEYSFGLFSAKYTEPVYHTLSYLLAKVSGGSKLAFDAFFSMLIYLPVCAGAYIYSKRNLGVEYLPFVLLVVLLLSINPAMVMQLVRQNLAASILVMAFVMYALGYTKACMILLLVSFLTHNSSALVAVVIFPLMFLFSRAANYRLLLAVSFVCAGAGYFAPYVVASNFYDVFAKNDGGVSIIVYMYDLIFLVAALYFVRCRASWAAAVIYSIACFYIFVLATFSSPLMMLRLYHYYDYLRWMPISIVFVYSFLIPSWLLFGLALALGLALIDLRYRTGAFDFGGGVVEILTLNFIG